MSIGEELAVTAATGIASINIGGKTLHSWAGVGLGQEETKDLLLDIVSSSKRRRSRDGKRKRPLSPWERWKTVRTLIVDEISMIDGTLLDKTSSLASCENANIYRLGAFSALRRFLPATSRPGTRRE
ncbi:hypothetical protein OE88DRAFT_158662 [Heliocybe sulcata]|uniref:ATP-dependent DNA helicase n=1 Tax=Heliocybe sulcata TaxID=5364 RepID=A0A5C3NN90_9AGAM|nr:hypothetical protein OE88DRAFT_158662 [Heliocybe sulcata]